MSTLKKSNEMTFNRFKKYIDSVIADFGQTGDICRDVFNAERQRIFTQRLEEIQKQKEVLFADAKEHLAKLSAQVCELTSMEDAITIQLHMLNAEKSETTKEGVTEDEMADEAV